MNLSHKLNRLKMRAMACWQYVTVGVWKQRSGSAKTKLVKTINLSVRSFMNTDIQSQACAMTYRTVLAIVPAFAMLFALGRGFGLQPLLEKELFSIFHSQREAIQRVMNFVDSYLNHAGEGVFVGIGILFLLWTLISLVSNVEDSFNAIWGVKAGRSIWRKVTDYTAMLLILPVLMICAGGLSVLISSTINSIFNFDFMTPVLTLLFEFGSWVFTWLFFTAVYMLIPNVKVKFGNAFIAGVIAGTGFLLLQWIFVTGQMYVAKYNAIYGSVAFIPLALIWLQLVWVITLSGAVLCYSSQNIFEFDFKDDVDRISMRYREKVVVAIATLVVKRFAESRPPLTMREVVIDYGLPSRLVGEVLNTLVGAGIISQVVIDSKKETFGYQPAVDIDIITVGWLCRRLERFGRYDFIPDFDVNFKGVVDVFDEIGEAIHLSPANVKLVNLNIDNK